MIVPLTEEESVAQQIVSAPVEYNNIIDALGGK